VIPDDCTKYDGVPLIARRNRSPYILFGRHPVALGHVSAPLWLFSFRRQIELTIKWGHTFLTFQHP